VVDRVKGRTQVEQDERNELTLVDRTNDIIVHHEHSSLGRMVTAIRRLLDW